MTNGTLPTIEVGLATTSIVVVSTPIQQRIPMATIRRIKIPLPKFKSRGDSNVFIKKFYHICYANQRQEPPPPKAYCGMYYGSIPMYCIMKQQRRMHIIREKRRTIAKHMDT
jgi:hypothetical protein